LKGLIGKGKAESRTLTHAQILLQVDEAAEGRADLEWHVERWTAARIRPR
jgi:hypothetical protein